MDNTAIPQLADATYPTAQDAIDALFAHDKEYGYCEIKAQTWWQRRSQDKALLCLRPIWRIHSPRLWCSQYSSQTVDSESLSIKLKAISGTLMSSIHTITMVHLCVPRHQAIERGRWRMVRFITGKSISTVSNSNFNLFFNRYYWADSGSYQSRPESQTYSCSYSRARSPVHYYTARRLQSAFLPSWGVPTR